MYPKMRIPWRSSQEKHHKTVEHIQTAEYLKTVKIATNVLQPFTFALASSTFATLDPPIQPSLQRPEAWSIPSCDGRLFALYEERHTLSICNPFFPRLDIDLACSGYILGKTLVLSMIRAINQQCQ